MRWIQALTAALLPLAAFAAKAPAADRFTEYHAKSSSGPLKLNDASYARLTKAPRDYSVAVLLTAMDTRFGCVLCREFQPEWELLGKSWVKGDKKGESKVVFGTLDFIDGKGTFQSLMLQTAPVLLYFAPTTGPNAKTDTQPVRYDFTNGSAQTIPPIPKNAAYNATAPRPPKQSTPSSRASSPPASPSRPSSALSTG